MSDKETVLTRTFDAARDFVVREYGAIERGKENLERLAQYLPLMQAQTEQVT